MGKEIRCFPKNQYSKQKFKKLRTSIICILLFVCFEVILACNPVEEPPKEVANQEKNLEESEENEESLKILETIPPSSKTVLIPSGGDVAKIKVTLVFNLPIQPIKFTNDEILSGKHPALKKVLTKYYAGFVEENNSVNERHKKETFEQWESNSIADCHIYNPNNGEFAPDIKFNPEKPNQLTFYLSYHYKFHNNSKAGDGLMGFSIPSGVFYVKGKDESFLNEEIKPQWYVNVRRARELRVTEFKKMYQKNEYDTKIILSQEVNIDSLVLSIENASTSEVIQTLSKDEGNMGIDIKEAFKVDVTNIPSCQEYKQNFSELTLKRNRYTGAFQIKNKTPAHHINQELSYYTMKREEKRLENIHAPFKELYFTIDQDGLNPSCIMIPSDDNEDLEAGKIVSHFDELMLQLSEPISKMKGKIKFKFEEGGEKVFSVSDLWQYLNEDSNTFTIPFTVFRPSNRTITNLKVTLENVVDFGGNTLEKKVYHITTYVTKPHSMKQIIKPSDWKISEEPIDGFFEHTFELHMNFREGMSKLIQPSKSISIVSDLISNEKFEFTGFRINKMRKENTISGIFKTFSGLPVDLWDIDNNSITFYSNKQVILDKEVTIDLLNMEFYGIDINNKHKALHPWEE